MALHPQLSNLSLHLIMMPLRLQMPGERHHADPLLSYPACTLQPCTGRAGLLSNTLCSSVRDSMSTLLGRQRSMTGHRNQPTNS